MSLRTEELAVDYGERRAVHSCTVGFAVGQLVGLLGPNGAGKTSLLRAISGLVPATGYVYWNDADLAGFDRRHRARTLAYLPQSPAVHWPLTVRELVGLGRLPHRRFGQAETAADRAAVEQAMAAGDIAGFATRRVDALSGGERMRVQLARVLAVEAPVLLVDEPVANLDPAHQLMVMELLRRYTAAGRAGVVVMHDLTLAGRFCDRIVLMHEGRIVGDGIPVDVLSEATLADVYGVQALIDNGNGDPLIVPWRRLG